MCRVLQCVVVMLAMDAVCSAQIDRRQASTLVTLRLFVTIDGDSEKAEYATVELMDAVGSSSAMTNKLTDNNGIVIFQTLPGLHRIRITAPSIQVYEGEVQIEPNETSHIERIRVRGVASQQQKSASPPGGLVSAARLNVPPPARKAFEQGAEAMHQQDWQHSRTLFETAIGMYPQYDMAYNLLGVVQIQLKEVDAARQSFSKAVEINPDFAEAYRNLARISFAEHKYEEADTLLTKSLSTDPLNTWALATAANAELITHKYSEAIAHARKAHSVPHSDLAGVHIVAALALEATQQPAQAAEEYQLYLQEDPTGRDAERSRKAIARLSGSPPN
jgi:tetratricopeptide (TPR) repeat protein